MNNRSLKISPTVVNCDVAFGVSAAKSACGIDLLFDIVSARLSIFVKLDFYINFGFF